MARERFIDTVVYNLLSQMIGPLGIGIHARPLAHWIKATEHLDGRGIVFFTHNRVGLRLEAVLSVAYRSMAFGAHASYERVSSRIYTPQTSSSWQAQRIFQYTCRYLNHPDSRVTHGRFSFHSST